ncbi:hypothetical protein A5742_25370 [Mycolicibacterium fortuitum]|uniref:Ribbon-helix-helix protein CopG domain-containing protein n=1 Tax=Mycolicibacterium fortuitum TaxID=1766 RepID=A0ABD6QNK7_MYCFO|nr:hypothetical protein [Mycolicibacterium fortuitum]OMC46867.1 hypothetical protein A5742_25370 [Mycolicibacterium fortuitum]
MAHKPEPIIETEDVDLGAEVIHVGDGQRLTEELADTVADQLAQTGRERSMANLVPGRKSLSGEGQHSPVVQARVPVDVRDELEELAGVQGQKPSKFVRKALEDSIAFYVVWEQQFDGVQWDWVRFDKALPLEQASQMFDDVVRIAGHLGYRRVQIRHGREHVVEEWPKAG